MLLVSLCVSVSELCVIADDIATVCLWSFVLKQSGSDNDCTATSHHFSGENCILTGPVVIVCLSGRVLVMDVILELIDVIDGQPWSMMSCGHCS